MPLKNEHGRFRVVSLDGETRVIDKKTGEDISHLCTRVSFEHVASDGTPILLIELRDFQPSVNILSGRAEEPCRSGSASPAE
jgi:hypothetical protein